jgi:hypothetical protein
MQPAGMRTLDDAIKESNERTSLVQQERLKKEFGPLVEQSKCEIDRLLSSNTQITTRFQIQLVNDDRISISQADVPFYVKMLTDKLQLDLSRWTITMTQKITSEEHYIYVVFSRPSYENL